MSLDGLSGERVGIIPLGENRGIAEALNIGIGHVRDRHPQFILTMDQDSLPQAGMVAALKRAHADLCAQGCRVGAVGPQQEDMKTGTLSPFLAPIGKTRRRVFPPPGGWAEVDHLISSGCLIPLEVVDAVGGMRASLFIDYVDIEWSLRCRAAGYALYAAEPARLQHRIGDRAVLWRERAVPVHNNPLRSYYLMRNGVILQKLPYIDAAWKRSDAAQLAKKFIFFGLHARPRLQHLKMMLLGLLHGMQGREGRME